MSQIVVKREKKDWKSHTHNPTHTRARAHTHTHTHTHTRTHTPVSLYLSISLSVCVYVCVCVCVCLSLYLLISFSHLHKHKKQFHFNLNLLLPSRRPPQPELAKFKVVAANSPLPLDIQGSDDGWWQATADQTSAIKVDSCQKLGQFHDYSRLGFGGRGGEVGSGSGALLSPFAMLPGTPPSSLSSSFVTGQQHARPLILCTSKSLQSYMGRFDSTGPSLFVGSNPTRPRPLFRPQSVQETQPQPSQSQLPSQTPAQSLSPCKSFNQGQEQPEHPRASTAHESNKTRVGKARQSSTKAITRGGGRGRRVEVKSSASSAPKRTIRVKMASNVKSLHSLAMVDSADLEIPSPTPASTKHENRPVWKTKKNQSTLKAASAVGIDS